MKRYGSAVFAGLVALTAAAAERSWQAVGDGNWSDSANWAGGILPGASDTARFNTPLTSDAVVAMDGTAPLVGAILVDHPESAFKRVFIGEQAVRSNVFARGRAELLGTWTSTCKAITAVGMVAGETAWLDLSGAAVFAATNQHALYVGNANNARGRVTVKDQARLSLSAVNTDFGISLGRDTGSVGSMVQEGGVVESTGRFLPGYYGYGAYELLGGLLRLPYGGDNTRYRLAVQAGSTGLFYQRGGVLLVQTNELNITYQFEICSANNNAEAVYYADGGEAHIEPRIYLLSGSTGTLPSYAELTVADGALVHTYGTVNLRSASARPGRAVVNLNRGGTLRTTVLQRDSAGDNCLNGDGGVLEIERETEITTLFDRLQGVTIFEGGLELCFPGAGGAQLATNVLRSAGGWGVVAITLGDGGSGYLAPPRVKIEGGSGSNATAVAFIDHTTGSVTGAVVTCRGEGYVEDDVLTVACVGGGGNGASAIAALAPNKAGSLIKSGKQRLVTYDQPDFDGGYVVREGTFLHSSRVDAGGSPRVQRVHVSGPTAIFQNGTGTHSENTTDRWDLVNPQAVLALGGDWGGGQFLLPCGAGDSVFHQHFRELEVAFGRNRINTSVSTPTNGAALVVEKMVRRPGGFLGITTTTNLSVRLTGDPAEFTFGTVRPILPATSIGSDTAEFTTLDTDGTIVSLTEYDADFGADSNLHLSASAAADGYAVNSVRMSDGVALTLQDGDTTVVGSGVIMAQSGNAGFTTVSGGALTSGNGADLILMDFHTLERRNVANGRTGLVVDSRITDNGTTPMALFARGRTWNQSSMSIASGPSIELTKTGNTYSGGTYILDTALAIADDSSLGAVPSQPTNNIFTSGMSMLRAPGNSETVVLHRNRGIRVCDGSLTFFGTTESQPGRVIFDVAGDISGEGVLVMNHWGGTSPMSVVLLSGDNRAFKGSIAVHAMLRLGSPESLPPRAGLLLCDISHNAAGGGILETSGLFTRPVGVGPGEVWWGRVTEVGPGFVATLTTPAAGGGFAAYGGDLVVNLGGGRRKLVLGENGFAPQRLRLQDDEATGVLYWDNPVDVTNRPLTVQVANVVSDKRVVWRGAVTSSATEDSGAFTKIGNGRLVLADGADFGPIAFTANNTVELDVTNRQELACNMSGNNLWLEKYGPGVTILSGSNTYINATRIYEGALYVNGTNSLGGTFTIHAEAMLGGVGMVAPKGGATVTVNGALTPGAAPGECGTLTLGSPAQSTTLHLNGALQVEISLENHDCAAVLGNVTFGDGATIAVTAQDETVWLARRGEEMPLLTWSGTKSGTWSLATPLPSGWKIREKADGLYAGYAPTGTLISVQ